MLQFLQNSDSSNKIKRLTLAGYADVYSKYGNKIDPNGTSGNARIAEINKIIGEFSDIEGKLGEIDSDGYKLSMDCTLCIRICWAWRQHDCKIQIH